MPLNLNRLATTTLALAGLMALSPVLAQGTPTEPPTQATSAPQEGKKDYSPAERLLLMSEQLKGLKAGTTLNYRYRHQGEGDEAFEDGAKVVLAKREDGGCCAARGEFLSGARKLQLPEVQSPVGNPVLLYFLERDIRQMNKITKGSASYFRKRIRMALYQDAGVRDTQALYKGKAVAAKEIIIRPYLDDPNRAKFEQFTRKQYVFVLSDAVPGSVVSIRSTATPEGSALPLIEEELVLDGAQATSTPAPKT